jgi:hypothetical protein
MSRELLQALDALDAITDKVDGTGFNSSSEFDQCLDAIDAIRQHLAQPQAQPVARPRLRFPTMLRKMWSGREVQEWIDVNIPAAPAPATPPGYVLVPVEPTPEMVLSAAKAWEGERGLYSAFTAALRAGIAAAPVPAVHNPWADDSVQEADAEKWRAVPAVPGWQPIETAPRSRDEVLLISQEGNIRIGTGTYAHHMMNAAKIDAEECLFTHWMHLPPAPGAKEKKQGGQSNG